MKSLIFILSSFIALFSAPALAYIDPGSGSAIMSAIAGFLVAVVMAVKGYWYKIKSFFMPAKAKNLNENEQKPE